VTETDRHLFVFGLGFSASALARKALGSFATVGGTVRSVEKAERLRAEDIQALVFDGAAQSDGLPDPKILAALSQATHLVQSIAPGEAGDPVLKAYGEAIVAAPNLAWIGYLSTVGVYGDHGGGWVDETTPCRPKSRRSIERLEAEGAWRALADQRGVPLAILRLAGIYGPGRNALDNLADGTARRLVKPGQMFNRIHVEDIATVTAAAADQRADGIFNVTDDEPAPPQDVVAFAAQLAGYQPLPDIPFDTADLSPMARSFYGENKRVANGKLKTGLGVALAYPTYREGFRALFAEGAGRRLAG
jgi:nucleoside-diphosphate-sugar epimerase